MIKVILKLKEIFNFVSAEQIKAPFADVSDAQICRNAADEAVL
jgi:hypothetical protein